MKASGATSLSGETPRWAIFLCIVSLAYGILSGIRWPGLWPVTQMLFDYEFGFVKRGLLGQMIAFIASPPYPYILLAIIAYAIFALWLVLLLSLLNPLIHAQTSLALIACMLFISPGFVFMVHSIGYLDHVGVCILLMCFYLPANAIGIGARVLMSGLALVVHEAFFLMYFPILVFDLVLKLQDRTHQQRAATAVALVVVIAALVVWYLGNNRLAPDSLADYNTHLAAKASDFGLRDAAVIPLVRTGAANLALMRDMWSDYAHWIRCSIDMLLTLPLALFFVALAVIRLDTEKRPRLLKFIAIAAAASPLTLHVVAWDFPRFNAATQLSAFLVFLSTARLRGMPPMGDGLQRVFQ